MKNTSFQSIGTNKLHSNIGGYVLHVMPLESFRGIIVHNLRLVMSASSHSSVWFNEKKSFRGNTAGVN